jgi:2,3,4,5-tetrahydropyridine-2-carboxylate N-succinyltransferase
MKEIQSLEQLKEHQEELEKSLENYQVPFSFGIGLARKSSNGNILDVWYPAPQLVSDPYSCAVLAHEVKWDGKTNTYELNEESLKNIQMSLTTALNNISYQEETMQIMQPILDATLRKDSINGQYIAVVTFIADRSDDPINAIDSYLRLHLLSARLVQPNTISLSGIFGKLINCVWTNLGPFEVTDFNAQRLSLIAEGKEVFVHGVDKFPRMTDYVIPSGVRIADANRVRLGAHLSDGTTIMHEGFCNFNAGTLGASMVEGRISAGVVVGDGSDIGGGASIMGTLSGGGTEVISVGQNCLLGAESGIGISLGDDCVVEAGLYVTAGTLVSVPDGSTVKAKLLSGKDNLLFRRNSTTGIVEVLLRGENSSWQGLNEELHDN